MCDLSDQGSDSLEILSCSAFQKVGLLTRLGCLQGLRWSPPNFELLSPFNLASSGFVPVPSLISNCWNLLFELRKVREAGVLLSYSAGS